MENDGSSWESRLEDSCDDETVVLPEKVRVLMDARRRHSSSHPPSEEIDADGKTDEQNVCRGGAADPQM